MDVEIDRLSVVAAPHAFLDRASTPRQAAALGSSVDASPDPRRQAYAERVARYEADLAAAYRELRAGASPQRPRPGHKVVLPGRELTISYDGTLDRQLLAVYVGHGWQGVQTVLSALQHAATGYPSRVLHPWDVVREFAAFVCAGLRDTIRAALIELDRKATADLVVQLNISANLVNDALRTLDVKASDRDSQGRQQRRPGPSPSLDSPTWIHTTFYTLGNTELSGQLWTLLSEAVAQREKLAAVKVRQEHISNALELGARDFTASSAPGRDSMQLSLAELATEAGEATSKLDTAARRINELCPLALLTIPLLKTPVTESATQQLLGEVLTRFRGESERLVRGLPNGQSWVADVLPARQSGGPVPDFAVDEPSPERMVVDAAMSGVSRSSAYLSMLSERTHDRLVETGVLPKDSFDYAVWAYYRRELILAKAAQARFDELLETVFSLLGKADALLSLLLFKAPGGPVLRRIALALGLSQIMFQTYSAIHQLALLDRQLALSLTDLDRRNAAEIARVSELLSARADFGEQLTTTIAKEIGLIAAAGVWPEFRLMLHMRGFYFDLETLVAPVTGLQGPR